MKSGPTYKVSFKRKREQKTDYKKRLAFLKSGEYRFITRISNNLVRCQVISYEVNGDKTIVSITSNDLKKLGWNYSLKSTPAIYLTALLLAKKLKEKNITKVIFDTGLRNYKSKSKIYAALKAIVDFGIICPHDPKAFPNDDRINGLHIDNFLKNNISKKFEEIKNSLLK
ncbi:MAG: 50S ribosomal protein L18 [Candidatus ainarchaeum sp.]|nr:50S ribosomal protein L18 [Candidatus ainarchaeum sp.]MDD3975765.1 50S ribosomal protein L18 [Candidatus ainarchaeum sp.]